MVQEISKVCDVFRLETEDGAICGAKGKYAKMLPSSQTIISQKQLTDK